MKGINLQIKKSSVNPQQNKHKEVHAKKYYN